MKLCVIGPTWPFRGGIAHFTTMLVQKLRETHDVRFVSFAAQYPRFLYPGKTDLDPSSDNGALKVPNEQVLTPFNPFTWLKAVKIILAEQPDAVVLQWWTPFWWPMMFAITRMLRSRAGRDIATIFIVHRLAAPNSGLWDWFVTRRLLWRGSGFIVMSEEEFALLRRALPHARIRSTNLPPFHNLSEGKGLAQAGARAQLGLPASGRVVLFFGIVRRYKGLQYLIDAFAQLPSELNDVTLLVAGEFWNDERAYLAQIQKHGLSDRIIIHNRYIANEDLPAYFCAADVLALPYIEAVQSGVAAVAIGFELPVITTDTGALPEMVENGKTGLVVPTADSTALAGAITTYFQDNLRPAFQENIRAAGANASWAPMVRLIEDLINTSAQDATSTPPSAPKLL